MSRCGELSRCTTIIATPWTPPLDWWRAPSRFNVTQQNIVEFWAVATRPVGRNGLGLPSAFAVAEIERIERLFALLPDHPTIYRHWKSLVATHGVIGNQVYDACLVAAMMAHGVGRMLTFNAGDFFRYGIEVIHPSAVL